MKIHVLTLLLSSSTAAMGASKRLPATSAPVMPDVTIPAGYYAKGDIDFGRTREVFVPEFTIDIWPFGLPGDQPVTNVSPVEAEIMCNALGRRLCTGDEWERACKGPKGTRDPYGEEYDSTRCRTEVPGPKYDNLGEIGRETACFSGYGVADMSGNINEWVSEPMDDAANAMRRHYLPRLRSGLPGSHRGYSKAKGGDQGQGSIQSRCAWVHSHAPGPFSVHDDDGFRCCRTTGAEVVPELYARRFLEAVSLGRHAMKRSISEELADSLLRLESDFGRTAETQALLGIAYSQSKRPDAREPAIKFSEEALALKPNDPNVRLLLGRLYLEYGLSEKAAGVLAPLKDGTDLRARTLYAAAIREADPREFRRRIDALHSENPDYPVTTTLLAYHLAVNGETEKAARVAKNLKARPSVHGGLEKLLRGSLAEGGFAGRSEMAKTVLNQVLGSPWPGDQ